MFSTGLSWQAIGVIASVAVPFLLYLARIDHRVGKAIELSDATKRANRLFRRKLAEHEFRIFRLETVTEIGPPPAADPATVPFAEKCPTARPSTDRPDSAA